MNNDQLYQLACMFADHLTVRASEAVPRQRGLVAVADAIRDTADGMMSRELKPVFFPPAADPPRPAEKQARTRSLIIEAIRAANIGGVISHATAHYIIGCYQSDMAELDRYRAEKNSK